MNIAFTISIVSLVLCVLILSHELRQLEKELIELKRKLKL